MSADRLDVEELMNALIRGDLTGAQAVLAASDHHDALDRSLLSVLIDLQTRLFPGCIVLSLTTSPGPPDVDV